MASTSLRPGLPVIHDHDATTFDWQTNSLCAGEGGLFLSGGHKDVATFILSMSVTSIIEVILFYDITMI